MSGLGAPELLIVFVLALFALPFLLFVAVGIKYLMGKSNRKS